MIGYKNLGAVSTVSDTVIYTVPTNSSTIFLQMQVAGVSTYDEVDIHWYDSVALASYPIILGLGIEKGKTIGILDGKLILKAGDKISIKSINAGSAVITLSFIEMPQ